MFENFTTLTKVYLVAENSLAGKKRWLVKNELRAMYSTKRIVILYGKSCYPLDTHLLLHCLVSVFNKSDALNLHSAIFPQAVQAVCRQVAIPYTVQKIILFIVL